MNENDRPDQRISYVELISVIPKMPTERLLQLIAMMKLELSLRGLYRKNEGLKND